MFFGPNVRAFLIRRYVLNISYQSSCGTNKKTFNGGKMVNKLVFVLQPIPITKRTVLLCPNFGCGNCPKVVLLILP